MKWLKVAALRWRLRDLDAAIEVHAPRVVAAAAALQVAQQEHQRLLRERCSVLGDLASVDCPRAALLKVLGRGE